MPYHYNRTPNPVKMKRTLWLVLTAISLTSSYDVTAQSTTNVDFDTLHVHLSQMVEDWDVPGMSIGVVKDGSLIFSGNYGTKETGLDATPDDLTLYAIASITKAFTTALIGMLVQEGKLNWNDKVRDHLPYFTLYDPWVSEHVTIRDILSHRVGLGTFSGDVIWYQSSLTPEEIIRRIRYLPQSYAFRDGYGYSNVMYVTAGEIIKTVTGKSWAENVRERILQPLGMDRTITSVHDLETKGNFATPHMRQGETNLPIPWVNWDEVAATGGLISCVEDMAKWMIFNLDHGIIGEDTLLTPHTRNMVWTPHNNRYIDHTSSNDYQRHFNAYGLGWQLSDFHGKMQVSHTGGYDGMISAIALIPDEDLGVIVLTNGAKSPIMAAVYHTLEMVLGINGIDWSSVLLDQTNRRQAADTRIEDIKAKRVLNTQPSIPMEQCTGEYRSAIYGSLFITMEDGELHLDFEHTPRLSASLTHWHHDVWEIHWDHDQAWFGFGTLKFNMDHNMEVTGFDLAVPNNDLWFEEFKPYRIKN